MLKFNVLRKMLVPNKGSVLSLYQMPFLGVAPSGELHQCVSPAVGCDTLLFITKGSSFGLPNRRGSGKRFLENTLSGSAAEIYFIIQCYQNFQCKMPEHLDCNLCQEFCGRTLCALSVCVSCLRQLYFAFNIKNSIISSKLWHLQHRGFSEEKTRI